MITQTPWFERKFNFDFPVGLYPVIVSRLALTIAKLEYLVKNVPDEIAARKKDNGWSVKEEIGHLYDIEDLWYGRIEDFLSGATTLRAADLANRKTHEADHNFHSVIKLLHQFTNARQKTIDKIEHIDEKSAQLTATHPRLNQPMRLIDSLYFVAEHDDHHVARIRQLLTIDFQ
jgi:uncharacterized damage-inducible protein DinB